MKIGDILYSNEGRGPLVAKVKAIGDGEVTLQRLDKFGVPIGKPFRLTARFMRSISCGWRASARKEEK